MAIVSTCPAVEDLERFLAGRLTPEEEERLAGHFETCPHCAESLHTLNPERFPDASGEGMRRWLADLRGPDTRTSAGQAEATAAGAAAAGAGEETYDFLTPPRQPGEL